MSGIVLSVVTGIVFLAGWDSANLAMECQRKKEDEKAQASKNAAVYSRARLLHGFPKGEE